MTMRKSLRVGIAILALAGVGIGFAWWQPWASAAKPLPQSGTAPAFTSALERGSLITSTTLSGTLSFGEPTALSANPGIITGLPTVGTEIALGQQVYEVEGAPIILMTGSRPFWRELSNGVDDGEDIRQLQQNLADLGYYEGYVGNTFDWYTEDALLRWQRDLGIEETGTLSPEDVVVTSQAPIRIDRITATLGSSAVSPATYTSPNRQVSVPLTESQAKTIESGGEVEVTTADGTTYSGLIKEIIPGKPATQEEDEVKPQAIITLDGGEDAPPGDVRITITQESSGDLLLAPVSALLAVPEGGYAVEVASGSGEEATTRRVPVEIGRVANGKAEILSGDVTEGDEVVMGG